MPIIILVFLVVVPLFVLAAIFAWHQWELVLRYGMANGWPEWFHTGNFWAWVVAFLGLSLFYGVVKYTMKWVSAIATLILSVIMPTLVGFVLVRIATVVLGLIVAHRALEWAAANPQYSEFFADPSWWVVVMAYVVGVGVFTPSLSDND